MGIRFNRNLSEKPIVRIEENSKIVSISYSQLLLYIIKVLFKTNIYHYNDINTNSKIHSTQIFMFEKKLYSKYLKSIYIEKLK